VRYVFGKLEEKPPLWARITEFSRHLLERVDVTPVDPEPELQFLDWSEINVLWLLAQSKKAQKELSSMDIARELNLPPGTVREITQRVEGLMQGGVDRILLQFPDYRSDTQSARETELA
jgi:hypothetical protein